MFHSLVVIMMNWTAIVVFRTFVWWRFELFTLLWWEHKALAVLVILFWCIDLVPNPPAMANVANIIWMSVTISIVLELDSLYSLHIPSRHEYCKVGDQHPRQRRQEPDTL